MSTPNLPPFMDWRTNYDKYMYNTYQPLAAKPYGLYIEPDSSLI